MNTDTNIKIASAACLIMGLLVASFALFWVTRGGWFSFIISCPFWSAAILLCLAGFRFYRMALFGFVGAIAVGSVAFAAGFFGPILFMPKSNQGPLLGIFFTGPIGTLAGTAIGLLTAIIKNKFRQP